MGNVDNRFHRGSSVRGFLSVGTRRGRVLLRSYQTLNESIILHPFSVKTQMRYSSDHRRRKQKPLGIRWYVVSDRWDESLVGFSGTPLRYTSPSPDSSVATLSWSVGSEGRREWFVVYTLTRENLRGRVNTEVH